MEPIEIIAAFVLSLAFLLMIWTVKGLLLRPFTRGKHTKVTAIIVADAYTTDLEREVANLRWLREDGRLNADVLIVDAGMDMETAELAEAIWRRYKYVKLCKPDEVAKIITRGIGNGAEG